MVTIEQVEVRYRETFTDQPTLLSVIEGRIEEVHYQMTVGKKEEPDTGFGFFVKIQNLAQKLHEEKSTEESLTTSEE